MVTEKPPVVVIQVSGNWDQIQRFFGLRSLDWKVVDPRFPNRVKLACADKAEGVFVYNALRQSKLVAFKNWVD